MSRGVPLDGAVVCVTGAARGIGAATARRFLRAGARVVLGDIDQDELDEFVSTLGDRAIATRLDVADPTSFSEFIELARSLGPVDVLVNNAGIQRTGTFVEQSLDGQLRELAINLGGPMTGMRLVMDEMLARGHGHIVNVSSMAGKVTVPGAAVYSASKFGVASLSRAVRAEITGSGVTITTVMPAAVRTDLSAGLDIAGIPQSSPDSVAKAIVASCRHRRHEVTIPGGLGVVAATEALPEPIGEALKRIVGAQRRLASNTDEGRRYQERVARS